MSFTLRTQAPKASSRIIGSSKAFILTSLPPTSSLRSFHSSLPMENPRSIPPTTRKVPFMAVMYRGRAHKSSPEPFLLHDDSFAGAESSAYQIAPVETFNGPANPQSRCEVSPLLISASIFHSEWRCFFRAYEPSFTLHLANMVKRRTLSIGSREKKKESLSCVY